MHVWTAWRSTKGIAKEHGQNKLKNKEKKKVEHNNAITNFRT